MQRIRTLGAFSSVALALAAASVINLPPFHSDRADIIGIVAAILFSTVFITLGYLVISKILFSKSAGIAPVKKAFYLLANLVAGLFMALIAALTLKEISEFTVLEVLPEAEVWSVFLLFAVVAIALTKGSDSSTEKTAAIFFTLGVVLTLLIFFFSLPKMSFKYIMPNGAPDITSALINGLKTALRISAGVIVAEAVVFGKFGCTKAVFFGGIAGGILMLLFALNTLLIFGSDFAGSLRFPYVSAVSTAAMGDIFSGLDGFLYIIVFLFSVFKIFLLFRGIKTVAANIARVKK